MCILPRCNRVELLLGTKKYTGSVLLHRVNMHILGVITRVNIHIIDAIASSKCSYTQYYCSE